MNDNLHRLPELARLLRRRGWTVNVDALAGMIHAGELRAETFRDVLLVTVRDAERSLRAARLTRSGRN